MIVGSLTRKTGTKSPRSSAAAPLLAVIGVAKLSCGSGAENRAGSRTIVGAQASVGPLLAVITSEGDGSAAPALPSLLLSDRGKAPRVLLAVIRWRCTARLWVKRSAAGKWRGADHTCHCCSLCRRGDHFSRLVTGHKWSFRLQSEPRYRASPSNCGWWCSWGDNEVGLGRVGARRRLGGAGAMRRLGGWGWTAAGRGGERCGGWVGEAGL